jgi:hypothetical protein
VKFALLIFLSACVSYNASDSLRRLMAGFGYEMESRPAPPPQILDSKDAAGEYDLHFVQPTDHHDVFKRAFRKDPSQLRAFLQLMLGPDAVVTDETVIGYLRKHSLMSNGILSETWLTQQLAATPAERRVERGEGPIVGATLNPAAIYRAAAETDPALARAASLQLLQDGSQHALAGFRIESPADEAALVDVVCGRLRAAGEATILNGLIQLPDKTCPFSPTQACAVLAEVGRSVKLTASKEGWEGVSRRAVQSLAMTMALAPVSEWAAVLHKDTPAELQGLVFEGLLQAGAAEKLRSPGIWENLSKEKQLRVLSQQLGSFDVSQSPNGVKELAAKYNELADLSGGSISEAASGVKQLISNFQAPTAILAATQSLPPGEFRQHALTSLVAAWAANDIEGASSALSQFPAEELQDDAVLALVREIRNDPEATLAWAQQLKDGAARTRITREQIAILARTDPASAAALEARWLPPAP